MGVIRLPIFMQIYIFGYTNKKLKLGYKIEFVKAYQVSYLFVLLFICDPCLPAFHGFRLRLHSHYLILCPITTTKPIFLPL